MKILFIYQGPHFVHTAFAKAITNDCYKCSDDYSKILANSFKSFFNSKKYDVLFLEGGLCIPCAIFFKIKNPKTKIILLNADTYFYILPKINPLKRFLMKSLLRIVDEIIAVSESSKKIASNYFKKEIRVVNPYGLFSNFDINCDILSHNLLFIGNYHENKRSDALVDAVRLLNKNKIEFELYLVGSCGDEIKDKFKWLHKEGGQTNINPYLSKCSIYVHPADFDPCPVTVFEAMSSGLIPIITENTGESTILKENNLDILILKNNDPETIAKKILEIYNKPDEWKKNVSKICKGISADYTKEKQVEKFKNTFYDLVNKV